MTLPRLIARLRRPVALLCLLLLGLSVALGAAGPGTTNRDTYSVLYWAAVGAAGVLLLALAAVPDPVARRIRLGCLVVSGLAFAVLQGNGLSEGLSHALLTVGAALALGLAVPSLVVTLESDQNRSVSRF